MKFGIAFSGGGMRGIAHLGVLAALAEYGIKPSVLAGTSSGAICGAFYSQGYSAEKIIEIVKDLRLFDLQYLLFKKPGLFSMGGFEKIYQEYFPLKYLENLPIQLTVVATDILNGKAVYFAAGELVKTLLASSCIPILFHPVEYEGGHYVDGSVLNNLPIEPLLGVCDKVIGIHVNSMSSNISHLRMTDIMERSFHFALSNAVHQKISLCDLFIEPPEMSQFGMFDFERGYEIYEYAYRYTKTQEKLLLNLLEAPLFMS